MAESDLKVDIELENNNKQVFKIGFSKLTSINLAKRVLLFSNMQPVVIKKFRFKDSSFFSLLEKKSADPSEIAKLIINILFLSDGLVNSMQDKEINIAVAIYFNRNKGILEINSYLDKLRAATLKRSGVSNIFKWSPEFLAVNKTSFLYMNHHISKILEMQNTSMINKIVELSSSADIDKYVSLQPISLQLNKALNSLWGTTSLASKEIVRYAIQFLKENISFSIAKGLNKEDKLFLLLFLLYNFLECDKRESLAKVVTNIKKRSRFLLEIKEFEAKLSKGPLHRFFNFKEHYTDREFDSIILEFADLIAFLTPSETPVKDLVDLGFNLNNIFNADTEPHKLNTADLFEVSPYNADSLFIKAGLIEELEDNRRTYYVTWYKDWGLKDPTTEG